MPRVNFCRGLFLSLLMYCWPEATQSQVVRVSELAVPVHRIHHDLGEVRTVGTEGELPLEITLINDTSSAVSIKEVKTNCDCAKGESYESFIPGGSERALRFIWNVRNKTAGASTTAVIRLDNGKILAVEYGVVLLHTLKVFPSSLRITSIDGAQERVSFYIRRDSRGPLGSSCEVISAPIGLKVSHVGRDVSILAGEHLRTIDKFTVDSEGPSPAIERGNIVIECGSGENVSVSFEVSQVESIFRSGRRNMPEPRPQSAAWPREGMAFTN